MKQGFHTMQEPGPEYSYCLHSPSDAGYLHVVTCTVSSPCAGLATVQCP